MDAPRSERKRWFRLPNRSYALERSRAPIEGLWALAVLAILAFDDRIPGLRGGFVGVDIGFVLAGFEICALIRRRQETGVFRLPVFYGEVLEAVLRSLFAVVLFCVVVGSFVLSPWEAYRLGQTVVAASFFGSNLLYILRGSFFAERAIAEPLLMTWSLGVVMQVCLVLPFLLVPFRGQGQRRARTALAALAALTVLSFVACVYGEYHQHVWNFYLPFTRAWEVGAGALVAMFLSAGEEASNRQEALAVLGGLLLLWAIVAYRPEMRFPGFEALLPVCGAVLLLAAPDSRLHRLISFGPLRGVGRLALPLYLWHWPLLSFAAIASARPLRPVTIVMVMLLTVALAVLTRVWIEPRVGLLGRGFGRNRLLAPAMLAALPAVCGGLFYLTKGVPARYPALYRIENRAALYRHYPCISSGSYLRMSAQCTPAPVAKQAALAVLGGGHAEAFAEGLRDFLPQKQWQLITLTRESCAPTLGVSQWGPADSTLADSCRRFNRSALSYVLSRPDIRAVVLVGRWRAVYVPDTAPAARTQATPEQNAAYLRSGLAAEADTLERAGKRVIVVEDTPEFPFDPAAAVRDQLIPARRALRRLLLADPPVRDTTAMLSVAVPPAEAAANRQVLAVGAADPRIVLIDPKQVFCNAVTCTSREGSKLFFSDAIHLSRTGAVEVLPLLPDIDEFR